MSDIEIDFVTQDLSLEVHSEEVSLSLDVNSSDVDFVFLNQEVVLELQAPEINLTLDLNSADVNRIPSYTFTQLAESDLWNINHNLGYKPIVQVFNSGSQMIMGTIYHLSQTQVQVSFTKPVSGFARLI